jgi:hypothetical protein
MLRKRNRAIREVMEDVAPKSMELIMRGKREEKKKVC